MKKCEVIYLVAQILSNFLHIFVVYALPSEKRLKERENAPELV